MAMSEQFDKEEFDTIASNVEESTDNSNDAEEMKALKKLIEDLQKQIAELNKEIQRKDKTILANQQDLEERIQYLQNLQNSYNSLNKKYEKVSLEADKNKKKLEHFKQTNANLISKNKRIHEGYEEQNQLRVKKHEELLNAILIIITDKRSTIFDISRELSNYGIKTTLNEINFAIQELKTKYEIDDSVLINFDKGYKIVAKNPSNNKVFDINLSKKSYEFIVFSDAHISYLTKYEIDAYGKVYDYMYNNNITTTLDLGDFLDSKYLIRFNRKECMKRNEELLNRLISSFPYEKGIKHLIMGGNHEELTLRYGIDPIEFLEMNREDFISLGYISAFLKFYNSYIGLFHPSFCLKEFNNKSGTKKIINFINTKCNKLNIDRQCIFMSLFGHFHIGNVYDEGIVTIPSITRDRENNGAWHVKIYFNSNGNIENAELTRIILGKRAKATQTYELGKKLTK